MKIKKFVQSIFSVNTFIIWDESSCEAAIIDPGSSLKKEEEEITGFIESNKLSVKYLLNTHCHIDHIFGNAFIKNRYNPEFWAPQGDIFLLDLMVEHAGDFGVTLNPSPLPDQIIIETKTITLGATHISFISTPGHTPDGYCFYIEKEKTCFTGDVLFKESIGRTDLWGGNFDEIMKSIKNKLIVLPDDIKIYPGHGENSTIGYEKNNNPFLT